MLQNLNRSPDVSLKSNHDIRAKPDADANPNLDL